MRRYLLGYLMPEKERWVGHDLETQKLFSSLYSDFQSLWIQRKQLQKSTDDPRAAQSDFERFHVISERRVNEFYEEYHGINSFNTPAYEEVEVPLDEEPIALNLRELNSRESKNYFISIPHRTFDFYMILQDGSGFITRAGSPPAGIAEARILRRFLDQIKNNHRSSATEGLSRGAVTEEVIFAEIREKRQLIPVESGDGEFSHL